MEYKFSLLGPFRVGVNGLEVNLKDKLGKQLSSVLAFLLVNHNQAISKEKMIDTFWQESDNPANALKYAIFRLRSSLKEIKEFENVEVVSTVNNGYQICDELNFSLDLEEFEKLVSLGKQNNDVSYFQKAYDLYEGNLLDGIESDWIDIDRGYYLSIILEVCNTLASKYLKDGDAIKATRVSEKGLTFDEYDERLIYLYLKSLIKDKKYNQAMSYYDKTNKKYIDKLGFALETAGGGFQEILSNETSASKSNHKMNHVIDTSGISGPMVVDKETMNDICLYVIRNSDRYDTNAYTLTITLDPTISDLDKITSQFMSIFEVLFRKTDVISKVNDNQFIILFRLENQKDTKIVEIRINSRLSRIYNNTKDLKFNWKKL